MEAQKVQIVQPSAKINAVPCQSKECNQNIGMKGRILKKNHVFSYKTILFSVTNLLPRECFASDSRLGLQPTHDGYEDEDSQSTDEGP